MRKAVLVIVNILMLFGSASVFAQEEPGEQEVLEWIPDLDWEPTAELLAGMEKIGELNTHLKSLKLTYPETIKAVGDKLYLFDVELENLLLFDAAGNFRESLFSEDQRITSHIQSMDIDDQGRVFMADYGTFYLFDNGRIESYENIHRLNCCVWDGEKVYGINFQMLDRDEGLIKEVTLEGELLGTWGDAYFKDAYGKPGFLVCLRRVGEKSFFTDAFFDGFLVIDPGENSVKRIRFDIPAFRRRIERTKESYELREKTGTRRMRVFPIIQGVDVIGEEIFLFQHDQHFLHVLVCDVDGNFKRVYRGLKPSDYYVSRMAVSQVEGEPRFFFISSERQGGEFVRKIHIYSPCEKVPTKEDLEKEGYEVKLGGKNV